MGKRKSEQEKFQETRNDKMSINSAMSGSIQEEHMASRNNKRNL